MSIGEKTVPLNETGGLNINFYGPGGTFTTYPAVDVIKRGFQRALSRIR